jgi:hypothetical protein
MGGESPKVTKPSIPNTKEVVQESLKPMSPDGAQDSPGANGAPTLPIRAALSSNPVGVSSGPKPTESPRTSPTSPRSYGLGATGGYHPREGSSVPWLAKPSQQYSWVAESLFDSPEFIQARFHINQFITVAVDTEVDWANTKALY